MSHIPVSNPMGLFRFPAVTPQDGHATKANLKPEHGVDAGALCNFGRGLL
jgi:hypothetical protein